jgi:hypothetical protein
MSPLKVARGAIGTPRIDWIEPCSTALIGGACFSPTVDLSPRVGGEFPSLCKYPEGTRLAAVTPPESVIRSLNMEHTMAFEQARSSKVARLLESTASPPPGDASSETVPSCVKLFSGPAIVTFDGAKSTLSSGYFRTRCSGRLNGSR